MVNLLLAIIFLIFISLGLPDALLGAAWPNMYLDFNVPISYCGIISFLISVGTIISSLFSDKLLKKISTPVLCFISTILTATILTCFYFSSEFWHLIVLAIPYGLGAGAIDAAINNYVAVNYESRHMSWLHAMWGIGASIGPYIMGAALTNTNIWNNGYLYVSIIQIVISVIILLSLPLWKNKNKNDEILEEETVEPVTFKEVFKIKGVLPLLICFCCYCALEQTAMLWGSSYLVLNYNISEEIAAIFASLFLLGITLGRFLNGFLAYKISDTSLIRIGLGVITLGIILIFIPNVYTTYVGLAFVGLGCAPIYPCIMHSIPIRFGKKYSQIIIGLQMAFAYTGSLLAPMVFGFIAEGFTISLLGIYLFAILSIMFVMHELVLKSNKISV